MSAARRSLELIVVMILLTSASLVVLTPARVATADESTNVTLTGTTTLTFNDSSSTAALVYHAEGTYASQVVGSQTFRRFLSAYGLSASGLTLVPSDFGYTTHNDVVVEASMAFLTANGTVILAQYYLNGTVLPIKEPPHGAIRFGSSEIINYGSWAGYQVHNCNYDLFGSCGVSGSGYGPYDSNYMSFTNPSSFGNGPSNLQDSNSWVLAIWTGGGNGEATNGTNPTWFLQGGEAFWGNYQAAHSPCSTSYYACFWTQYGATGTPTFFTPSVSPYGRSMTITYFANANCISGGDYYVTQISFAGYVQTQAVGCIAHANNTYAYLVMESPLSSSCSYGIKICQIPSFDYITYSGALEISGSYKSLDSNADYTYQISMNQAGTTNISTGGLTDNSGSTDSTWTCTFSSIQQ
ncbi:MAG: hypothetical protein KGI38_10120 [Thaumarchaeota archaeon]|nr:hypothetical protein [Nitrososphaerota archaeon]